MFYLIDDQALLVEYKEENKIVKVFPNRRGTRVVCIDATGNGFFFNPVTQTSIMIPNFSSETINVLFDLDDRNLFVTVDKDKMSTYLFVPLSLEGP